MEKLQTMDTKKILVSFLTIVSVLFLAISISAATSELVTVKSVEVNGIVESGNNSISVVAGEKVSVQIIFKALENASDVRMKAELQGTKLDSQTEVFVGDVETGKKYIKTLNLKVPYELKDEVSNDLFLNVKIWNGDFKTEFDEVVLRVQRASYNVGVMSIGTSQTINAGETFPVDIVLKNVGYNKLDDLYVTVKIAALNVKARAYFGDLVALEDYNSNNKKDDTVRGRLFLEVPYNAAAGIYTLEVEVSNNDLAMNEVKQIVVKNELPESVIKSGNGLILVNPTNKLKVYKVIPESPATVSESTIVVSAGSSRAVTVNPNSAENFSVNVFSGENLVGTVGFTNVESKVTSSIVVLTVILAIIFIVLLVVLVVLLTKKPEKDEEFSESYY